MRLLFIGDIFGRPGREAVAYFLPRLRESENIDFVVANAENAAHGGGLMPNMAEEFFSVGVDVITMGNHTWDKKEIKPLLSDPRLLRPANYPPGLPGRGWGEYEVNGHMVGVLQVMGRHGMTNIDCPFRKADEMLSQTQAKIIFVDMHAEASSEKQALGWYLDGRVSAVVGSHTHVQTADNRLLAKGTGYLGDAGMTGPRNSVIGSQIKPAVERFLKGIRVRFEPADGESQFCACLIDIDETSGHARDIHRVFNIYDPRTVDRSSS